LQEIINSIFGMLYNKWVDSKDNADKEQSMISNNDQSILYYIAGYILRSLRKKYLRYSKHKLSLVDKVSGNSEKQYFWNAVQQMKPIPS
jgi:UDP-N-acetylglucosamine pyrophosphorylase